MLAKILSIALGASLGANLRYFLTIWAARKWGAEFPYGTLIINVVGSFGIGVILTLGTTRIALTESTRLFLVTGLLGGFTTFSTFSFESLELATSGRPAAALFYVGSSVGLGLVAAAAGVAVARIGAV